MCVAIYKPAGATIPKDDLEACFKTNDDGAGFATPGVMPDGKPTIYFDKGFFTFDDFWKVWDGKHQGFPDQDALIHFRVCTHGGVSKGNCHPFIFTAGAHTFALIHNGVISEFGANADKLKKSDTRMFVEQAIMPLAKKDPEWLDNKPLMLLLRRLLGHNKIVIMRDDGRVEIIGEAGGDWKTPARSAGKVWYSNTYWEQRRDWPRYIGQGFRGVVHVAADRDADTDYEQFLARTNDRNEWWSSGVRDADEGVPYKPDTKGVNYCKGYLEKIQELYTEPLFEEGYMDFTKQTGPRTFTGKRPHQLYMAGWYWAEYEAACDAKLAAAAAKKQGTEALVTLANEEAAKDAKLAGFRAAFAAAHNPAAQADDCCKAEQIGPAKKATATE